MEGICPLLALAGDARSVVEGVDPTHRCHADEPPQPVERRLQARTCLTADHARCERFLAHVARNGAPARARAALGDGLVVTRLSLTPEPTWRGLAGRATTTSRRGLLVAGAGAALSVVGGAGALTAWALGGLPWNEAARSSTERSPPAFVAAATSSPGSPIQPTPDATARPTPAPTVEATATPAPTPAPTSPPTPAATAAPAVVTYLVQEGDTLAAIAARFGTSVAAIQAANGIADPNQILIGEVLVIP